MAPLLDPSTPDTFKDSVRAKLGQRFDWVSEQLEGRAHTMADGFSVADGYLVTILSRRAPPRIRTSARPGAFSRSA